jgi:hypothetical protein
MKDLGVREDWFLILGLSFAFRFNVLMDQSIEESARLVLSHRETAISSSHRPGFSRISHRASSIIGVINFVRPNSSWWFSWRDKTMKIGAGIFKRLLAAFGGISGF